jgi:hypothetical protein
MTIKFIIPYHQWMKYSKNEYRECRKNEYGDIYFVVDLSFLVPISRLKNPRASFSDIVNMMEARDENDTASGDVSLYFDYESRNLFHDRELKDRAIILYLSPTISFYKELRDRICSFTDSVAIFPNILFIKHCKTNGHIALLGRIKRIAELLMVEKRQKEYVDDMSDIPAGVYYAIYSDIQVENDRSVVLATSPFHICIAEID